MVLVQSNATSKKKKKPTGDYMDASTSMFSGTIRDVGSSPTSESTVPSGFHVNAYCRVFFCSHVRKAMSLIYHLPPHLGREHGTTLRVINCWGLPPRLCSATNERLLAKKDWGLFGFQLSYCELRRGRLYVCKYFFSISSRHFRQLVFGPLSGQQANAGRGCW